MNDTDEKLKKANDLRNRIKDIEWALVVFDSTKNVRRGDKSCDITGTISFKIKGKRFFGCGSHETDIDISYDMVNIIEDSLREKLNSLRNQLDNLFK